SAQQALIEGDVRRENRAKVVDKVAAVFILQGYLDKLAMERTMDNASEGE
ncbi:Holliday junction resolvase RuvX, partial [Anaerosporobacter sp.]